MGLERRSPFQQRGGLFLLRWRGWLGGCLWSWWAYALNETRQKQVQFCSFWLVCPAVINRHVNSNNIMCNCVAYTHLHVNLLPLALSCGPFFALLRFCVLVTLSFALDGGCFCALLWFWFLVDGFQAIAAGSKLSVSILRIVLYLCHLHVQIIVSVTCMDMIGGYVFLLTAITVPVNCFPADRFTIRFIPLPSCWTEGCTIRFTGTTQMQSSTSNRTSAWVGNPGKQNKIEYTMCTSIVIVILPFMYSMQTCLKVIFTVPLSGDSGVGKKSLIHYHFNKLRDGFCWQWNLWWILSAMKFDIELQQTISRTRQPCAAC